MIRGEKEAIAGEIKLIRQKGRATKLSRNLKLSGPIQFFGDKEQYIVFSVNDPDNSLSLLNQDLKEAANRALVKRHDLYNKDKSEAFEYVPHIALGRMPIELFESKLVKKRIYKRIEVEVFPLILALLKKIDSQLSPKLFCLYGFSNVNKDWRKCLTEFSFKNFWIFPLKILKKSSAHI